jgi:hypothetical protein
MAVKAGYPPGWLITADGTVMGDFGTHGPDAALMQLKRHGGGIHIVSAPRWPAAAAR